MWILIILLTAGGNGFIHSIEFDYESTCQKAANKVDYGSRYTAFCVKK